MQEVKQFLKCSFLQLFSTFLDLHFRCVNCLQKECGLCKFCKDKPKFGGKSVKKQLCQKKKKCFQYYKVGNLES